MSQAQKINLTEKTLVLKGKEATIYKAIERLQPTTLTEIKEYTKFQHQTVSSRVSTLYSKGIIKIVGKTRRIKNLESLYKVCTTEEREERQRLIREELKGLIKDHAQALIMLGGKAPKTREYLIKQMQGYKAKLETLKLKE